MKQPSKDQPRDGAQKSTGTKEERRNGSGIEVKEINQPTRQGCELNKCITTRRKGQHNGKLKKQ